ncbi:hypothetical protein D3C87_1908040 [compost metagenome]
MKQAVNGQGNLRCLRRIAIALGEHPDRIGAVHEQPAVGSLGECDAARLAAPARGMVVQRSGKAALRRSAQSAAIGNGLHDDAHAVGAQGLDQRIAYA